ncbi:hypothetical protein SERLA73DRAFT_107695 [Serpula lacrymans var. lacrymans S7.3]|uniref:Uncharacterized protein n=2 Tax=Serpula lacrymans var. lacrymans TaxID=341189 RepID=F8PXL6_SERL3|nr:uncharacterized protein SERLADRAFT_415390 [Serpula lacrymans var. lacrymans S7.9]EGN98629.1 hypothetical protein SERLA73DRAFT_107695 [Serpula lacrymans var. lacrymans S7.3]EGO24195.1 hypothetical protein SERLADRAFT_415390 [Serpula lacrymans var. lacrymans S7.9]
MDKTTAVIAAFDAGKLPNQHQVNQYIDWSLNNVLSTVDSPGAGKLSEPGKILANGLRNVLQAYRQLGSNKNGDNQLQEALWHLSEGDYSHTSIEAIDTDEATADIKKLRAAIRTLIHILWTNSSGEGSFVLNDFASFARLAFADLAGVIESQAGAAKDSLREFDSKVQQGERDNLGRKRKSPEEQEIDSDPKVKFEKTMDVTKQVGSKAIGVGQNVKSSAEDTTEKTSVRLREAYFKICDRAQSDEAYHNALVTLFDTFSKWMNKSLDTAADVNQSTNLDTFIDDPTEEQHILQAIQNIRTLVERLADGKSLDDVLSKIRTCAVDVRRDEDLKSWFNEFFAYVRGSLEKPGYARSEQAHEEYKSLTRRWKELLNQESEVGQQWKQDVHALRHELRDFQHAMAKDADLQRVRKAHSKFADEVERGIVAGGQIGFQFAVDQASWFWQDIFNVYAQRILGMLKDIPIPRTEYVDSDVEFVLENLDISSLNVLPGHVYIRNITDIDISAPESGAASTTAIGTLTHIRLQAMQLALKEVSFWYKDKTATIGPSDFTGLMEFTLPSQGIDVDLKFRLIPNTPQGLEERQHAGRYFKIERVDVTVSEDVTVEVKQSNHAILASVFKPVFVLRFREALEKTLQEQIRGVFQTADALAWDVGRRSEVFSDTGLGPGASLAAAIWSEIGRFRKMEGGVLEGWKATGTGVVKDNIGSDAKIAMGAEPQILSGEKHGPLGISSKPLSERLPGIDTKGIKESGKGLAEQAKGARKEGLRKVQSFKQTVDAKTSQEKSRPGWQSSAFSLD